MPYMNYGNYYQPYGGIQPQVPNQFVQSGIAGKVVNDFNEIVANDVPMNGSYAFFVKNDMSEIQARAWSADGKIVPIVFKPYFAQQPNNVTAETKQGLFGADSDVTDTFMKRFDDIQARLESIEDIFSKQTAGSRRKKEVDPE